MLKWVTIIPCLVWASSVFGQVDVSRMNPLSLERFVVKEYSKEFAEKVTLRYMSTGVLEIPDRQMYSLELDLLVADNHGELTTLFYHCRELDRTGLVFAFFGEYANPEDYSQSANWRTFRNLSEDDVAIIISGLSDILNRKDQIMKDNYDYAIYRYQDLTFTFFEGWTGKGYIRVYYNGFESDWSDKNFKKTAKRFERSVKRIGK